MYSLVLLYFMCFWGGMRERKQQCGVWLSLAFCNRPKVLEDGILLGSLLHCLLLIFWVGPFAMGHKLKGPFTMATSLGWPKVASNFFTFYLFLPQALVLPAAWYRKNDHYLLLL